MGLAIWVALYISDYTLTLICARLYQSQVRDKIAFEGSYELTPYYQRDIGSLRRVSPRFIFALFWTSLLLFVMWQLSRQSVPEAYSFFLGTMILKQLVIHMRHFRNLFLFRAAGSNAVCGRIEYSRRLTLRLSALEMLEFSGLFIAVFAFTHSWFVLGGATGCLALAGKHWRLARSLGSTSEASLHQWPPLPSLNLWLLDQLIPSFIYADVIAISDETCD